MDLKPENRYKLYVSNLNHGSFQYRLWKDANDFYLEEVMGEVTHRRAWKLGIAPDKTVNYQIDSDMNPYELWRKLFYKKKFYDKLQ